MNLNNLFDSTKKPSIEYPSDFDEETTTTKTTTTTTLTTTTTTRVETYYDQKGFFVTQSESSKEDQPQDCSFNGRGHEAVLMPSGNYYCRSTQQRVTIYVDGVEKICCVTP